MKTMDELVGDGKLWLYDISTDQPREANQADIDRLVCSEQTLGALILAIREMVKPRPGMSPEDRMKLMRNFHTAIDGVAGE